MYTLLCNVGLRRGLVDEAPSLALSLVLAELFYKFGSFTRECVAFLVTWYAISYVMALIRDAWSAKARVGS
jgi:hypothetical protein